MEAWLRVHDIEETTREGYEAYARLYINPAFGEEPVGKISPRSLEEFYTEPFELNPSTAQVSSVGHCAPWGSGPLRTHSAR